MSHLMDVATARSELFQAMECDHYPRYLALAFSLRDDLEFVNENEMTPLQYAAAKNKLAMLKNLIDLGANLDSTLGRGATALHYAASSGCFQAVLILLDAGCNRYIRNRIGRTPIHMATFAGHYKCVAALQNYVSVRELQAYVEPHSNLEAPVLPANFMTAFQKYIADHHMHPIRVALNVRAFGLSGCLSGARKILINMSSREIMKSRKPNENLAFKYHYYGWILACIIRVAQEYIGDRQCGSIVAPRRFVKLVANARLDYKYAYVELLLRKCLQDYPYKDKGEAVAGVLNTLKSKHAPPLLSMLWKLVNIMMPLPEATDCCGLCAKEGIAVHCETCGRVGYCGLECKQLHWYAHIKFCTRYPMLLKPTPLLPIPEVEQHGGENAVFEMSL